MSADNGIYIAKFPDGYRVCYGAAIDNVDYYPEGSKERKETLKDYFGESKVYLTEEKAFKKAYKMYKKYMKDDDFDILLEYGICSIGEYESFNDI